MRILVTGSEGYIGKPLTAMLTSFGYEVYGFDAQMPIVKNTLLVPFRLKGGCRGDIEDVGSYIKDVRPDAVIHLAALAEVGGSDEKAAEYERVNIGGTAAVLRAMQDVGCRRLLFASSSSVYGNGASLREGDPLDPASVYGKTKRHAEGLIRGYQQAGHVDACNMRFFNVIGAAFGYGDEHGTSVVPKVFEWMLAGEERFPVDGMDLDTPDGTPVRDYVYLGDLCRAILVLLMSDVTGPLNLGSGKGYSVLEVLDVARLVGQRALEPVDVGPRPNDVYMQVANVERAQEVLGWSRVVTFVYAMRTQWEWQSRGGPVGGRSCV